jgi:hypothetical protein
MQFLEKRKLFHDVMDEMSCSGVGWVELTSTTVITMDALISQQ